MDITAELDIAAKIHGDMTGKPNAMANSIRRGIAEIERLRASLESSREVNEKLCQRRDEMDAEIAALRARAERAERRIADAPTVCANTDNIVEIAHSLGYYDGTRVALVVVND